MNKLFRSIDPELADLAEKRGYFLRVDVSTKLDSTPLDSEELILNPPEREYRAWLEWSDESERVGQYPWDAIFEPFQLFTERPGESPYLSLYTGHRLPERLSLVETVYREAVQALGEPGNSVLHRVIPRLYLTQDALNNRMRQLERQLKMLLPSVQRIVQVWVAETERVLLKGGWAGAVKIHLNARFLWKYMTRSIDREEAVKFYRNAGFLWQYMIQGTDREGLEMLLGLYGEEYSVPPLVARSTQTGLLFFHVQIAPIHDKLIRLDVKRFVCEEILGAILLDEEPPGWDAIKASLGRSAENRGRPYEFPIKDTKRWYAERSESGSKKRIIIEIQDLHEKNHKKNLRPAYDTIRDQIRKIEKGE